MKKVIYLVYFIIILFFTINNFYISNKIFNYYFISAFFSTNGGKKHKREDYLKWSKNFFRLINQSINIYIQKEYVEILIPSFFKGRISKYKTIWNVPCISKYKDEYYNHQFIIDKERKYHSPDYYAIWNSKICFLKMATESIQSKIYIWIDLGSKRDYTEFYSFPSLKIMNELYKLNKMFFFIISNFKIKEKENPFLVVGDWIEGTSFGGVKDSIQEYYSTFWKVHNYYIKKGLFIGKDQSLYNTIALFYQNVSLIKNKTTKKCRNKWFSFYCLYAGISKYIIIKK